MVLLCTRAIGAILNYTLIREFRKRFLPQSNHVCPCSHKRVETQADILNDYSCFIYKNADYMLIKYFVLLLGLKNFLQN